MNKCIALRKAAVFLYALLFFAGTPFAGGPVVPKPRGKNAAVEYAKDRIIVKFKAGVSMRSITALSAEKGTRLIHSFESINACCLKITTAEGLKSVIERYRNDPGVLYAEPDYKVHKLATPDDPQFSELWGLHNRGQRGGTPDADIDAPEAWDLQTGRSDIIIAVIDSGVDYNHADLQDNMWRNPREIPGNSIDDDRNGYVDDVYGYDFAYEDSDPYDGDGHGTHVSGTIAAVGNNGIGVVGVNWRAKIMALKFLDDEGGGLTSDAVRAIQYAKRMGAGVINASWGGGAYSQSLKDAIAAASNAGILFVAAAGNDGVDNDGFPHYPSSYDVPNVIAVAASDRNDRLGYFSNFGATSVDLAAPGVSILSTTPGDTFDTFSGTSMATPHVAGAAALIKAQFPGLGLIQIKRRILGSSDRIPIFMGKMVTGGRLDVFSALEDDLMPPASVTDLTINRVKARSVTLTWTATGDDGDARRAGNNPYDVRYSTLPINSANFESATPVAGSTPQWPGSVEKFTLTGLRPETTYYFALKVLDNVGNISGVSNSPSSRTTEATIYAEVMSASAWPTGGTPQDWHADDSPFPFDLPFTFPFYDMEYNTVYVSPNGFIDFKVMSRDYSNSLEGLKNNVRIAPLWDDLSTEGFGEDIYIGQPTSDSVSIRWRAHELEDNGEVNVEVVLFQSGDIAFHYGDGNYSLTPTVGISAGDGESYLVSQHNNVIWLTNAQTSTIIATEPVINNSPIANAGPDKNVTQGQIVTLDGSGSSDPDGNDISFHWTQMAGPSVELSSSSVAQPMFTAPEVASDTILTFRLTVTDKGAPPLSDNDTVDITVTAGPPPPPPPIVVSVDDAEAAPGGPVDIPINVDNGEGILRASVTLGFDPNILKPIDAIAGSLTRGFVIVPNFNRPSQARINIEGTTPLNQGSGSIVIVKFQVKLTAPGGTTSPMYLLNVRANDGHIPTEVRDGSLLARRLGDADNDGRITSYDAALTSGVANGLDPELDAYPGIDPTVMVDVNGDGLVTDDDATSIARAVVRLDALPFLTEAIDRVETLAQGGTIAVDNPRAFFGQEGTVSVRMSDIEGLLSADLTMTYDPHILIAEDVELHSGAWDFTLTKNLNEPGTARISVFGVEPFGLAEPQILNVIFRCRRLGESPLNLNRAEINAGNVPMITQDGSILVVPEPPSVWGYVKDENGDTISAASIELRKKSRKKPRIKRWGMSDSPDGVYGDKFGNLAPGSYRMKVRARGYKKARTRIYIGRGASSVRKDFVLKPKGRRR